MKERTEWHEGPEWRKKFEHVASEKGFRVSEGVFKILEFAIEVKNDKIKSRDHLESMMQALAEDAITYAAGKRRKEITFEDVCYAFIICRMWPFC